MISQIQYFFEKEWYYYKKKLTKKYYIINRSAGGAGFFSNYMWVLGHVIFAQKLGYIPVVDMENYSTLYSEDVPVNGEKNAWNYYFENVGSITLKEAYESGSFVMGQDMPLHKYEGKYCVGNYRFPTRKAIEYYAPVIEKNIVIKKELADSFETAWAKEVSEKDRVLGIHVRGTDMKNNLGHPMPAAISAYVDRAMKILEENPEITKVFLATDECNAMETFEKALQNTKWELFMNDAFRIWDTGEKKRTGVHETKVENERPLHKYLLGKEVLNDAYFLNKCDYLLCGHSNITNVVLLWNNNKYKQVICIGEEDNACVKRGK